MSNAFFEKGKTEKQVGQLESVGRWWEDVGRRG